MKLSRVSVALLFLTTVLFNVLLLGCIEGKLLQINCFSYETAFEQMKNHNIPDEVLETFVLECTKGGSTKANADSDTHGASDAGAAREDSVMDMDAFCELLTMYFSTGNTVTDVEQLQENIAFVKQYRREDFMQIKAYVSALWCDLECFPVGKISGNPDATVEFADSWMQSRTFGGDRVHEGTDVMATENKRGIYPVYSITDGVVENIGWLTLGGWRIGIRSDSGTYFYYAHLAEYAKDFEVGDRVEAGEHLGFMGDTGYSDIPGTTGNFPVHLHLGIYLNNADGTEFAVNSYPMLRYLWERTEE